MTESRDNLKERIAAVGFAAFELNLYLDTHPCDCDAINLLREYAESLAALTDRYEKCFGPLKAFSEGCDDSKWQWIDSPWPWEL